MRRRDKAITLAMLPKRRKTAAAGRLIGYARASTDEQGTDPQLDELRVAGCATILEEHASGADRRRPVLARRRNPGGGPARSSRPFGQPPAGRHRAAGSSGAHFRSLRDPIDTSTPQGMFSLQVLGGVAQLERALIAPKPG
jgi:Resolvase, N terminal domain